MIPDDYQDAGTHARCFATLARPLTCVSTPTQSRRSTRWRRALLRPEPRWCSSASARTSPPPCSTVCASSSSPRPGVNTNGTALISDVAACTSRDCDRHGRRRPYATAELTRGWCSAGYAPHPAGGRTFAGRQWQSIAGHRPAPGGRWASSATVPLARLSPAMAFRHERDRSGGGVRARRPADGFTLAPSQGSLFAHADVLSLHVKLTPRRAASSPPPTWRMKASALLVQHQPLRWSQPARWSRQCAGRPRRCCRMSSGGAGAGRRNPAGVTE